MAFTKITTADTADKGVVGLPNKPAMAASEIQHKFDELALDVLMPKHNALIDELEAGTAGASIGVKDANNNDTTLQARLNDIAAGGYTKTEADAKFLTITGAEETYLTQASAESTYLAIEDAPTKVSDLTNDSGFITSSDVPTKTSDLTNDSGFVTSADIPTKVSDLTNDSGFITSASVDSLTDTNITNVSDGQILKYDSASSKWVNGTGGGGGSSTLADLTDTNISTPTASQPLTYDATNSKWINGGVIPIANGGTGNSTGYVTAGQKANTTLGTKATCEGWNTTASGTYSHAEGYITVASGDKSHSEGEDTTASGRFSHSEGGSTTASGYFSHAEGGGTTASGDYSHAGGRNTIAGYDYQTVIGKYNNNKSTTLFEVGNGTDLGSEANAFEVYSNGDINCTGAIKQNGTDVIGKRLTVTISSGTTLTFTDSSILSTSILDLYVDSNTPVSYDSVTVTSGSGATFTLSEAVTSSTTFLLIVR